MVPGFWALVLVAVLALGACGGSKSTNNAPSNSPATSPGAATTTAAQPTTTGCTIPQNNGGDHDADNNGGPSDGDGCQ
jgi:hypothetical protein